MTRRQIRAARRAAEDLKRTGWPPGRAREMLTWDELVEEQQSSLNRIVSREAAAAIGSTAPAGVEKEGQ